MAKMSVAKNGALVVPRDTDAGEKIRQALSPRDEKSQAVWMGTIVIADRLIETRDREIKEAMNDLKKTPAYQKLQRLRAERNEAKSARQEATTKCQALLENVLRETMSEDEIDDFLADQILQAHHTNGLLRKGGEK